MSTYDLLFWRAYFMGGGSGKDLAAESFVATYSKGGNREVPHVIVVGALDTRGTPPFCKPSSLGTIHIASAARRLAR
eukprot:6458262-Amphidinium_carterae.1